MLQGFYWDSYEDTKWTNLTSQVDELSKYFDLIWIPNSGSCGSGKQMGYMPQYWFTNHNSSFGTEEELLNMIRVMIECQHIVHLFVSIPWRRRVLSRQNRR